MIASQSPVAPSAFSLCENAMADSEGICPNTLDDVLSELADWNIILSEYEEELREIYGSDQ